VNKNFAAAVAAQDDRGLKILAYNFEDFPQEVDLHFWRLPSGDYRFRLGPDRNFDDHLDEATQTFSFPLRHRGDKVTFRLPSQVLHVIEVTRTQDAPPLRWPLTDLAMGEEDVQVERTGDGEWKVAVTVHNIGSAPAPAFEVALVDSSGKKVAVKRVAGLDASLDLEPKRTSVAFAGRGQCRPAGLSVQVDPDDRIYEITEVNNVRSVN
jgi:hypothetical protein